MGEEKKFEKVHDPSKSFSIKKTLKKIWHFLWKEETAASYIAFIIITFVVLRFVAFPAFLFVTGYSDIAAVVTGSMEHNALTSHTFYRWLEYNGFDLMDVEEWEYLDGLNIGDVIIVKPVPAEEIEVGDVVLFYSDKRQIIHRVMFIEERMDNYYFTTKGDANPSIMEMEQNIPYSAIKGRLVSRIPYLGWPRVILSYIIPII